MHIHSNDKDVQSINPVELNLWYICNGIDRGIHLRKDSNPIGKKENSIRKPLPNKISINTIKLPKNIVVKPSISNEIVIYRLPSKNRYMIKHISKNIKLDIVNEIDVKEI